jgi:hypothetical protein
LKAIIALFFLPKAQTEARCMDAPEDTGARIIKRLEELLQQSTLPPETVLNMLRRADAKAGTDPTGELERLQRAQRNKD